MASAAHPQETSPPARRAGGKRIGARLDAAAAGLWCLGWVVLAGSLLGLIMALYGDPPPLWIGALVLGGAPGVPGAFWRPRGLLRLIYLLTWGLCVAMAATLTGGLTGPVAAWCVTPLLASAALGGPLLEGALISALALGLTGASGLVATLPAPQGLQGLVFTAGGLAGVLIAALASALTSGRRTAASERATAAEIAHLQGLLGDLPYLAVALDSRDAAEAVFGQPLHSVGHDALYGGLAAAAAPQDADQVRATLAAALDHGAAETRFTPAADPERVLSAALQRTAAGGLVAVLRDITDEVRRKPLAPPPQSPPPAAQPAAAAAAPVVAAPFNSGPDTRFLSLTARLAEAQVLARDAQKARQRAETEAAELRRALAAQSPALAPVAAPVAAPVSAPAEKPAPEPAVDAAALAELRAAVRVLEQARVAAEAGRERAEQTLAARSRFLANMSHELRTPLNAIMGFSDIMRTRMFGALPGKYGEYADLIHESGRHLIDLINDVLDMSKIEAERFELSREVFDVREAVNAALRLVRVQAEEAHVQLRGVQPSHALLVDADRRAIKQIVLNLVSNALKFTQAQGQVTVTSHASGDMFEIVVADTGIGIARHDLERLGRPFEQAGDSADRARGSGLGLSLVKAFAQLHGGEMSIESQLGEGTAVTVRMPIVRRPAPAATSPETAAASVGAPGPGAQVIPLPPRS